MTPGFTLLRRRVLEDISRGLASVLDVFLKPCFAFNQGTARRLKTYMALKLEEQITVKYVWI